MSLLCVPICEANVKDALAAMTGAKEKGADLVELRLDYIGELDDAIVGDLVDGIEIPKIVTIRCESEGGFWNGDDKDKVALLETALSFGAEYVDIEESLDIGWRYEIAKACRESGSKLIISHHDFEKTPSVEELIDTVKNMYAAGANIAKIAVMPQKVSDVCKVLSTIEYAKLKGKDVIAISMGDLGQMSRVFGPKLGSYLSYASLDESKNSAAGQIPIEKLRGILNLLD